LKILELQKYQNKKLSKFTRRKANTHLPPLRNFTQNKLKTHKMIRKTIENFRTSEYQNKKLSKSTKAKHLPFSHQNK
jgi:hypothetical protein